MDGPLAPGKDSSGWLLAAVLVTLLGGCVATLQMARSTSAQIDDFANEIVLNSTPSIERLASLREGILRVELVLSDHFRDAEQLDDDTRAEIESSLASLSDDVRLYSELEGFPGEQLYWSAVQDSMSAFDQAVRRTVELLEARERERAREVFVQAVEPAGRRGFDAAMRANAFNAEQSRALARRIQAVRDEAIRTGNIMGALCIALGIAGALLIRRQMRRRRALVQSYLEHQEARAAEFEQFAGRVAHDIRNPLSSARLATELAARRITDENTRDVLARALRGLSRAEDIIAGLLEFARAGARPEAGAWTDPRAVLAELESDDAQEAAQIGVELRFEPVPAVRVACSEGVFLSIVGNLLRNAVKYMGDVTVRQVTVRVVDEGSMVRTEVSDTGPGIPAEYLRSVFDLYFRGQGDGRSKGMGLGLATVKRLVETHGGTVGVRSTAGSGSTFWFLLPKASCVAEAESVAEPSPFRASSASS